VGCLGAITYVYVYTYDVALWKDIVRAVISCMNFIAANISLREFVFSVGPKIPGRVVHLAFLLIALLLSLVT